MKIVVNKSFFNSFFNNTDSIEKAKKGEMAAKHKYIYRRETGNPKVPYIYVWIEDLIINPLKQLTSIFGIDSKLIDETYNKLNIKQDYNASVKDWQQHLLEYFCHQDVWDKRFSDKKVSEKWATPVTMNNAENIVDKNMETPEPVDMQQSLFEEPSKKEWKANPSLMRKIYGLYTGKEKAKEEKQKEIAVEKIDKVETNDTINAGESNNGRIEHNTEHGRISGSDKDLWEERRNDSTTDVFGKQDGDNRRESVLDVSELGDGPASDTVSGPVSESGSGRIGARAAIKIRKACKEILKKPDNEITEADKAVLAQYVGAGGTGEEGASVSGTLYEYYTPQKVIDKVWQLVDKYMPDRNKTVIEPSSGIGRFANGRSEKFTMFELEEESSRIARILHPEAEVITGNFEKNFMKKYGGKFTKDFTKFDCAVGNPPYGNYKNRYKAEGEGKEFTRIESYFLNRTLDTLKDGGICAMVLPSSFLDSSAKEQNILAGKAKILEAWRLPSGTFDTTGVGTDIVVFRKEPGNVEDFTRGNYFKKNPSHVMGTIADKVDRWDKNKLVKYTKLAEGENIEDAINRIDVNAVKMDEYKPVNVTIQKEPEIKINIPSNLKIFDEIDTPAGKGKITGYSYSNKVKNGYIVKLENGDKTTLYFTEQPESEIEKKENRRRGMLGNKNAAGKHKFNPSIGINQTVEEFNKKYGRQIDPKDLDAWKATDYNGHIDISKLNNEQMDYIKKSGNFIEENNYYTHVVNYASGNIFEKLKDLEEDFKDKKITPEDYEKRKALLNAVKPIEKKIGEFTVSPISDWTADFKTEDGLSLIDSFFSWVYAGGSNYNSLNSPVAAEEIPAGITFDDIKDYIYKRPVKTSSKEAKGKDAKRINFKKRVLRREAAEAIFNRYLKEGLTSADKNKLTQEWNETFNAFVNPDYAKIPILVDGMNTYKGNHEFTLTEQQLKGVSFLVNKGSGLLAYDVGLGKTAVGLIATVNQIQTGRAKRPLICVPKSVYKTWVEAIHQHFPNIEVNELGNFKDAKNELVKEGSITICSYEALNKLTFHEDSVTEIENDLEYAKMTSKKMNKRQEASRKNDIDYMAGTMTSSNSDSENQLYIEDMGFDHITIDECFPYNTKVLTEKGWCKIGQLKEKGIENVYSYNCSTNKIELKKVIAFMPKELNHKVLKLNLDNGGYIVCTHNHKIYVKGEGYVRAEETLGKNLSVLSQDILNLFYKKSQGTLTAINSGVSYKGSKCKNTRIRQEERALFESVRVESIEILEQGSYGEYGFRSSNDKTVYDITVEDNHNFIAEGMIVSNCHNFKNIFEAPRNINRGTDQEKEKQSNEFTNLGGSTSARGQKLFAITQYIQRHNNNRNVFGLSATPFQNSPIEIYNILSLFARKRLRELHIYSLEEFVKQFAELETDYVVTANGFEEKSIMKNFNNLGALQSLINEYIDKVDGAEAGVIRPYKRTHTPELEMTDLQKKIMQAESEYIAQQSLLPKDERDNGAVLVSMNAMRTATLAPALLPESRYEIYRSLGYDVQKPEVKDVVESSPKLKFTCDSIIAAYKKDPSQGQVVYMPQFKSENKSVFPEIIKYFEKNGVSKEALGIFEGSASNENELDKRQEKIDEFNSSEGKCKIIFGSKTIAEGMNLQSNSTALYNLQLGWNPTETAQVEGRIWRQGNKQGIVHIVYPLLYDTIDSMMYQKYEEKQSRIDAVFSYKGDKVNVSDISPEELKLGLIRDPVKRANLKVQFIKDENESDYNLYAQLSDILHRQADIAFKSLTNNIGYKRLKENLEVAEIEAEKNKTAAKKWTEAIEGSIGTSREGYVKQMAEAFQVKYESNKNNIASYKKEIKKLEQAQKLSLETLKSKGISNEKDLEKKLSEYAEIRKQCLANIEEADNIREEYIKQFTEENENKKILPTLKEITQMNIEDIREDLHPMDEEFALKIKQDNDKLRNIVKSLISGYYLYDGKLYKID